MTATTLAGWMASALVVVAVVPTAYVLTREALRVAPAEATITAAEISTRLAERREARAAKDFARSDAIRDELAAAGVEVMDGDPLGWDWKLDLD